MSIVQKQTHFFKETEITKKWYLVDAGGKTLGRIASQVAHILRGKHKPMFTPNVDCGDFVIVVNAANVQLTGKRKELKKYFHYTGYPGGAKWEKASTLLKNKPESVIEKAVRGMIPHNRLGKRIAMKLKIYRGVEHPHSAQKPEPLTIK